MNEENINMQDSIKPQSKENEDSVLNNITEKNNKATDMVKTEDSYISSNDDHNVITTNTNEIVKKQEPTNNTIAIEKEQSHTNNIIEIKKEQSQINNKNEIKKEQDYDNDNEVIEMKNEQESINDINSNINNNINNDDGESIPNLQNKKNKLHRIKDSKVTFTPTNQEFENSLNYIESIVSKTKEYGINKIIPPKDWKPTLLSNLEVS